MSKLNASLNYKDEQNNEYEFELYSIDHEFLKSWGGVYVFTKRDSTKSPATHSLKYIGKAKSFDTRFDSHDKIGTSGINCIGICKVTEESKRIAIETSLIKKNKPPLNTQHT